MHSHQSQKSKNKSYIIVAEKATTLQITENLVILIFTLAKREDVSLAV
jgi:hypothetical protein